MTIIYNNQNVKLGDLNYGDVFCFCSNYETTERALYMKVNNTLRELDECGIVNLKTGCITREKYGTTVFQVNASIHVD